MVSIFEAFGLPEQPGSATFWSLAEQGSPRFIPAENGWQALFLSRSQQSTLLRFDDRPEPVEMTACTAENGDVFHFAIQHFPAPFRVSYGFTQADNPSGLADPLNPVGAGPLRSIASTPDAAEQAFWPSLSAEALLPVPPTRLRWSSELLGARRTVRMQYIGPEVEAAQRVVLLLDGDDWIHLHPAGLAFTAAHQAGELSPCTLVFVPSPGGDKRREELALNPLFWRAVREELLPLIATQLGREVEPASTVLAGQSYGGLAALYAAVTMPETFPQALCQSGSFWYPAPDASAASGPRTGPMDGPLGGAMARLLSTSELDLSGITVAFDVGSHEGKMVDHQAEVFRLLAERGASLHSNVSAAGHDRSSWRDALLRDTAWMLRRIG
ncbi:alpha/beta hydrolase-fold protein [Psychromicrobium lacuslunae]|uniref:Enterochelin esterase n=1 Tax=Psychromicrobium lacuslunae TaxID=1618207 RepID=A0A0D4BWI2_9MICC|nr:alpha/beta hydrolase-fold protein [Psychromicrobium lacuslunae]AJT40664.1 hypothetical protein UM93_02400 [Psychromicrobium lacuslunae]